MFNLFNLIMSSQVVDRDFIQVTPQTYDAFIKQCNTGDYMQCNDYVCGSTPCGNIPFDPYSSNDIFCSGSNDPYSETFSRLSQQYLLLAKELNQLRLSFYSGLESCLNVAVDNLRIPSTLPQWTAVKTELMAEPYNLTEADAAAIVNALIGVEMDTLSGAFSEFNTTTKAEIACALNTIKNSEANLTNNKIRASSIMYAIRTLVDRNAIALSQMGLLSAYGSVIETLPSNVRSFVYSKAVAIAKSIGTSIQAAVADIKENAETCVTNATTALNAAQSAAFTNMISMINSEIASIQQIIGLTVTGASGSYNPFVPAPEERANNKATGSNGTPLPINTPVAPEKPTNNTPKA